MRRDSLPTPGLIPGGFDILGSMSRAISAIEVNAGMSGGTSSMAKQFDTFLVACRTAIAGFVDAVAPAVSSRTTGAANFAVPLSGIGAGNVAGNYIRIRANKMLDRMYVPPTTAFAVASPAKVVTGVVIDGPDIILTLSTPLLPTDTTATVAYTQPGAATNARDMSGNALPTFGATAVANTLT